jgi:hypothetical protein
MPVSKVTFTAGLTGTPYSAGDVVGGVLHFKGLPANRELLLTTTLLDYFAAAIPAGMTSFTMHLYSARPGSAYADNTAWDIPSGDRTARIGSLSLGSPADKGATLSVETDQNNKHIQAGQDGVFAYLVTAAGYTPAADAETYALSLAGVLI